ncbi:hypothetical protein [Arthrobacter woluwensis]|uniref:hypothetical protein n=1 Tax=Arthrobacter woluwensis TaxID=156980 RepID=UPI00119EBE28|nr:hypothetical protein [Arthrobacter woluwensis]
MSEDVGYRDPAPWRLPVVVPDDAIDERLVYRSEQGIAVWATLTFDGEPDRIVEGFAVAWTREYVLVQTLWQQSYFLGTRKFWLNAAQVKRRAIIPSRPNHTPKQVHNRPQRGWRRVD